MLFLGYDIQGEEHRTLAKAGFGAFMKHKDSNSTKKF